MATVFSLAAISLVYGLAFPAGALAWDNCPKGLVNDPYPGVCRRYIDTNDDGICDLSQPKPAATTTTTEAVTTTTKPPETTDTTALAVTTATSGEPPTGDCPLGPCAGCGACLSLGVTVSATAADDSSDAFTAAPAAESGNTDGTSDTGSGLAEAEAASATVAVAASTSDGNGFLTHYLVSPIALGFFLIYGVSFFLYKTKRIRMEAMLERCPQMT